jgi:hypothetical protein
MAEPVHGTISDDAGQKDILLNNAATEATLQLLLRANLVSSREELEALKSMIEGGGILDGEAVENVNRGLQRVRTTTDSVQEGLTVLNFAMGQLRPIISGVSTALSKLSDGTAQASDILAGLKDLPLGLGTLAGQYSKLAAFQEANLAGYQKLTQTGINFGGSLEELRLNLGKTNLTMDQFTGLMGRNGEALARLGGTSEQGAKNFIQFSAALQNSQTGMRLRELGYTSEELNENMIRYISITGGRGNKELGNTEALVASTGQYMEQLDTLAKLTGKSKEKLQAELDEASKNAAYQRALAKLGPEDQKRQNALMMAAVDSGMKGAVDIVQSKLTGLPVDKAGQALYGSAAEVANVFEQASNQVRNSSVDAGDLMTGTILNANKAAVNATERFPVALEAALIRRGDAIGQSVSEVGLAANRKITEADIKAAKDRLGGNTTALKGQITQQQELFEARRQLNDALQDLATASMPRIKEVLDDFTSAVRTAAGKVKEDPKFWLGLNEKLTVILSTLAAAAQGFVAYKMFGAARALTGAATGAAGRAAATTAAEGAVGATTRAAGTAAAEAGVAGAASGARTVGSVAKGVAKGAGVGLAVYGVDYVAGKAGLGQKKIDEAQDEKNWQQANFWEKMQSSVARGIENVGDIIVPNLANQARADRIADETKYLKEKKEREEAAKAGANPVSTEAKTGSGAAAKTPEELMIVEIKNLNTTMNAVLRTLRTTIADNTENTRKAVEQLDNDFFHRG